jgi:hypothetical protein
MTAQTAQAEDLAATPTGSGAAGTAGPPAPSGAGTAGPPAPDAVSPAPSTGAPLLRGAVILLLVLGLQVGFIAAYVGALHSPSPHRLPVGTVRDAAVERIQSAASRGDDLLAPTRYADRAAALTALAERDAFAVVLPDGRGGTELRIASAGAGAAAEPLAERYGKAAVATGTHLTVYDDHPLPPSDNRGLSAFYLVIGWVVGGYLGATALSIAAGAVPATVRLGALRVGALLAYSILSGVAGSIVVGPVLDIWSGHGIALAAFGTMVTFGAAATAAALSGWLGIVGTGAAIVLFVVLGNPGSGGPFPSEMLPTFFRGMREWVLPGVGTDLVRAAVYFGGHRITGDLAVLWAYGLGGTIAFLAAAVRAPGRVRGRLLGR